MTTSDWIATVGVLVQVCLFGGLVWYCVETRRIRIASQSQLEALHTPCVTFRTTPRENADAVLDMDGAVGMMNVDFYQGDAMLMNIGTGPAVNVSYVLTQLDRENRLHPEGYVSFLPTGLRCNVPISRNTLRGRNFQCVIRYESLSQTRYETKLAIRDLVLTPPFHFDKIPKVQMNGAPVQRQ